MTSEQRLNHWQGHHEAWRRSGLSQRAYCEQQSLSYANFGYWRKRITAGAPQPSGKLIPLDIMSNRVNVVLTAGGIRVEIPSVLLHEALPLVLRTLRDPR